MDLVAASQSNLPQDNNGPNRQQRNAFTITPDYAQHIRSPAADKAQAKALAFQRLLQQISQRTPFSRNQPNCISKMLLRCSSNVAGECPAQTVCGSESGRRCAALPGKRLGPRSLQIDPEGRRLAARWCTVSDGHSQFPSVTIPVIIKISPHVSRKCPVVGPV